MPIIKSAGFQPQHTHRQVLQDNIRLQRQAPVQEHIDTERIH